jgi:hypothetical protein
MESFKCKECGKIYLDEDLVQGRNKMTGCCYENSLIKIKNSYTVKELIDELYQFNMDAIVSFAINFNDMKITNAFSLVFNHSSDKYWIKKDKIKPTNELKMNTKEVRFCIGNKFLLVNNRELNDERNVIKKIESILEYDE